MARHVECGQEHSIGTPCPENKMVDNRPQQVERQHAFAPSRAERRKIAKRRGIFKDPGKWQQINRHTPYSGHRQPNVNLDKSVDK